VAPGVLASVFALVLGVVLHKDDEARGGSVAKMYLLPSLKSCMSPWPQAKLICKNSRLISKADCALRLTSSQPRGGAECSLGKPSINNG
jgi:hypothetical protein